MTERTIATMARQSSPGIALRELIDLSDEAHDATLPRLGEIAEAMRRQVEILGTRAATALEVRAPVATVEELTATHAEACGLAEAVFDLKHRRGVRAELDEIRADLDAIRSGSGETRSANNGDVPVRAWAGVWHEGRSYARGVLCTDKGATWLSTEPTKLRPGVDASGWKMIAKGHGR